jgi:hypothetical protein
MPKYQCHRKECTRIRSEFSIFLNRRRPPRYGGNTFCSDSCLWTYVENELNERWRRLQYEKDRRIPRPKLGTILMQTAFVTRDQLEKAVELQNQTRKGRIGEWLLRLGYVEEHQVTAALAKQYGLPLINLKNTSANTDAARMIPGRVAKCSGVIPVGFDDGQESLRVAVTAPVDFNSQEAIRRMVRKGIVAYIGDQSAIERLLEQCYRPEELDLSNVPRFGSLKDLIDLGSSMVSIAIRGRAQNIQAELVQDFFWVRLDFSSESHHHFFLYAPAPAANYAHVSEREVAVREYAAVH